MGKTLLVYDMNLREMENYEKIYKDIGKHEKMLLISVWQFLLRTSSSLVNIIYTFDEWFGGFLGLDFFFLLDSAHICVISIL